MGQAYETASRTRRNGHVRGALKSRANDVITDISELKKDVTKLAEAVGKVAKAEAVSYTDRLSHLRDDARERFVHLRDDARSRAEEGVTYVGDKVRARPVAAVGISVGVGMVLGALLARR